MTEEQKQLVDSQEQIMVAFILFGIVATGILIGIGYALCLFTH